jgi:hypothetical protein
MEQTTFEDRLKLVKNANIARKKSSKEDIIKRISKAAIRKEKTLCEVGILEDFVIKSINEFNPIAQKAFGTYNIDIACGPIAIEIHNCSALPHSLPHIKKKIINLLKSGWCVIYIKFRANAVINETTINQIRSICEISSSNPSINGKYWVIRGTGETISVGSLNGDDISIVNTSKNLINYFGINKS